jgi:TonB family protein
MDGNKPAAWKFVAASVGFHFLIGGLSLCILWKPWSSHQPVSVVQVSLVDPMDTRPASVRSSGPFKNRPISSAPSRGQPDPVKSFVPVPPDSAKENRESASLEMSNESSVQSQEEEVQPLSTDSPAVDSTRAQYDSISEDETRSDALSHFLSDVRDRLEQAKHYPWLARIQGQEGTVRVQFVIDATGEAREIRLLESSRSKILDQEAVETVRRVGRFAHFPVSWNKTIQVQVPLVFQLNPP